MVYKLPVNDNRKFLFLLKDRITKLIKKRTPANKNLWYRNSSSMDIISKFSNNIENKKLYEQLSNYLMKIPFSGKSPQKRYKGYKDINEQIKSLMNTNDNSFINSQVPRIEYTAEIIYLILQAAEKYADNEKNRK